MNCLIISVLCKHDKFSGKKFIQTVVLIYVNIKAKKRGFLDEKPLRRVKSIIKNLNLGFPIALLFPVLVHHLFSCTLRMPGYLPRGRSWRQLSSGLVLCCTSCR